MPQGVEHGSVRGNVQALTAVRIPLMPQGVEHRGTDVEPCVIADK